jgi:hypothetical protein
MGAKGLRQDHYDVLGVIPDAPEEVIRAAYRALAAKYHPDRNADDKGAELQLKRLNAAFAILGNPEKRKQYDELTRSPEGDDEPSKQSAPREPARWKVPEERTTREPRWKIPEEKDPPKTDNASPPERSRVERVATDAAGGFGRVLGWVLGAAIALVAVAAVRGGCGESPRGATAVPTTARPTAQTAAALTNWVETDTPKTAATANWVWTTRQD